jgi:DNA-binding XRE family transcriptional regulator
MNDAFATTSEATLDDFGSDFASASAPIRARQGRAEAVDPTETLTQAGKILLDSAQLRQLRQSRLLSQQDLADDCWRRNIRVSIATIKRAESGHAVRFRIARELARCFDVPVMRILSGSVAAAN